MTEVLFWVSLGCFWSVLFDLVVLDQFKSPFGSFWLFNIFLGQFRSCFGWFCLVLTFVDSIPSFWLVLGHLGLFLGRFQVFFK